MKETLHCSNGLDQTRVRRAFEWVVTFRDFPKGSFQSVDGDSMMTEAVTLFTKGHAELHLDGVRFDDRIPGELSTEYEVFGQGGTFRLSYTMPTTRVCIPEALNKGRLPVVRKIMMNDGDSFEVNGKYLVCLGSVSVSGKIFEEEKTFKTDEVHLATALNQVILMEFVS